MSTVERESDLEEGLDPAERRLSLGHRLMMLGHLKSKFQQSRAHLNRYRNQGMDQAMGAQETKADPLEELDDMLVLGNVTVTTTHEAAKPPLADTPPPSIPPSTSPEPRVASTPSMLSKSLPYVLTALTTAGGLGGAGWLAGLFDKPEPPPTVQQPVDFPSPPSYGLSL